MTAKLDTVGATSPLELVISVVLRAGVTVSCLLIATGAIVTLVSSSTAAAARRTIDALRRGALHPPPSGLEVPHTLSAVFSGVARESGPALAMLGIVLLIATPVLRVAVSLVAFALERDLRFVVITSVVLAILLASFAIS